MKSVSTLRLTEQGRVVTYYVWALPGSTLVKDRHGVTVYDTGYCSLQEARQRVLAWVEARKAADPAYDPARLDEAS